MRDSSSQYWISRISCDYLNMWLSIRIIVIITVNGRKFSREIRDTARTTGDQYPLFGLPSYAPDIHDICSMQVKYCMMSVSRCKPEDVYRHLYATGNASSGYASASATSPTPRHLPQAIRSRNAPRCTASCVGVYVCATVRGKHMLTLHLYKRVYSPVFCCYLHSFPAEM